MNNQINHAEIEEAPKKKKTWIIILVVVLALILVCCLVVIIGGLALGGPVINEIFEQVQATLTAQAY